MLDNVIQPSEAFVGPDDIMGDNQQGILNQISNNV